MHTLARVKARPAIGPLVTTAPTRPQRMCITVVSIVHDQASIVPVYALVGIVPAGHELHHDLDVILSICWVPYPTDTYTDVIRVGYEGIHTMRCVLLDVNGDPLDQEWRKGAREGFLYLRDVPLGSFIDTSDASPETATDRGDGGDDAGRTKVA